MTVVNGTANAPMPAQMAAGRARPGAQVHRRPWRHMSPTLVAAYMLALDFAAVIVSGLLTGNTAYVLQGGLIVAALAIVVDAGFRVLQRKAARRAGFPS